MPRRPRTDRIVAALVFLPWLAAASTLCIAPADDPRPEPACVAVSTDRPAVEASSAERRYAWHSDDGRDVWLGRILPGQKVVTKRDDVAITVDLKGSAPRAWPVETTLELSDDASGRWRFTLPTRRVVEPVTLHLPRGTWDLRVAASGYQLFRRSGIAESAAVAAVLQPALRVTARVVTEGGEPVAFAALRAECGGKALCETAVDGKLNCYLDGPPPEALCIDGPRSGRKRVAVDPEKRDLDLGNVILRRGTTVRFEPAPAIELPSGTKATLVRRDERLETRTVSGAFTLEGVEPGEHALELRGPEEGQRVTIPFTVGGAAEQTVAVDFLPYRLTGVVRRSDGPFARAAVELLESGWEVHLQADEEGRFSVELWAPATFAVQVRGGGMAEAYATMRRSSITDSDWTIDIPNRKVLGRVTDAATGAPVPGATVRLGIDDGSLRATRNIVTDANGAYELPGVAAGTHSLTAMAPDYVAMEPVTFRLAETDREHRADVQLVRGKRVRLTVVDGRGMPRAGAVVMHAPRASATDGFGRTHVVVPPKSTLTVYVLPKEGSFAVARIDDSRDEAQVTVADPAGTIRVSAVREEDQPVTGALPRLRWNGELLPRDVVNQFTRLRQTSSATDARGELLLSALPAGRYDLCLELRLGGCDRPGASWSPVAVTGGETRIIQRYGAR